VAAAPGMETPRMQFISCKIIPGKCKILGKLLEVNF